MKQFKGDVLRYMKNRIAFLYFGPLKVDMETFWVAFHAKGISCLLFTKDVSFESVTYSGMFPQRKRSHDGGALES
jgi:hypothetical protein